MVKKLFTQIRNEWKSNTWLAVELLLVSVVMWYMVDSLYTNLAIRMEPRGFDIEHTYLVEMGMLTEKSPDYKPYEYDDAQKDEVNALVERLRQRPEVEAVSLSWNSYPYNGSNNTQQVQLAGDTLMSPFWTIYRQVTPDFVRVFRYRGMNGETPEELAEMLERGEILASNNLFRKYGKELKDYKGQRFCFSRDTSYTVTLGAALQNVRYGDYYEARNSYCVVSKLNWVDKDCELCIRVRADQDKDFIERLKADSEKLYRVGNIFISEVRSMSDMRHRFQQYYTNKERNTYVVISFLSLNIFLGLLGTFWFRTQQRRGEIALHKVHGATNGDVLCRLLCEGLFLLLIVTPVALAVDYALAAAELSSWYNGTTLDPVRLLACAGITFALISLMILIGIGIPARKAMKIQAAEALHSD